MKENEISNVGRALETSNDKSQLSEKASSAVVISFGRLNPPTTGHQKLVDKVKSVSKSKKADAQVYMSHTADKKKNPLAYKDKLKFAKKAFGNIIKESNARTIMQVLAELDDKYDEAYIVVGSDRIAEFNTLVQKYNGKDYQYSKLEVISAGERDPDSEDVSGMSASKLRALATQGNYEEFRKGLPIRLTDRDAKLMYDLIRKNLNVSEETEIQEVLDMRQRMKRRAIMRRLKGKIKRGRMIAQRRKASPEKIKMRAQRKAKQFIRSRVAGKRGAAYKDLPISARISIDKMVAKRKVAIARLAKRLIPKVKRDEAQRLRDRLKKKTNEELMSLLVPIVEQVEFETISENVEKNLIKKSERYEIPLEEIKKLYVECRSAYYLEENAADEERWTFNRLNVILANEQKNMIDEAITYHLAEDIPFSENIFRMHSSNYYKLYTEAKKQYAEGRLSVADSFDHELLTSDIGEFDLYEGESVPLDLPLLELDEEENVELNKPKRGGPKKFYVFVKDPQTGNVKKVTFGDTSGLKAKLNNPEARKSFVARHQCDMKKDKTKPGYWACRLPYYAKQLGLSGGGSFFW
jgi:nicotinic acid mononucleotide adenylyltransferase